MIGAGIFALLGEAGAVAGAATWISSLLGLGVRLPCFGYVVVKLGVRYPSSGGLFKFLLQGFGTDVCSGSPRGSATCRPCSSSARCAPSRSATMRSHCSSDDSGADWWDNSSPRRSSWGGDNRGHGATTRRDGTVADRRPRVGILAVFVVVTLPSIDLDLLAFSEYPSVSDIVASVALTFFAFLGFSVITFAVGDMQNPARDLPKAMNRALGVTTLIYILFSVSVFGTLTVAEVVAYGPTAIGRRVGLRSGTRDSR